MVILALAAWFGLLAPLWMFTSRTNRAPLDLTTMRFYESNIDSLVAPKVKFCLPNSRMFPDIAEAVELVANKNLDKYGGYSIQVEGDPSHCSDEHISVSIHEADETLYAVSDTAKDVDIMYERDLVARGELPEMIALILLNHVMENELAFFSNSAPLAHHVAPYSPAYHLTFSLFYGGGDPLSWDIDAAMSRFRPLVSRLQNQVANITIDSQVEYYAELGTVPRPDSAQHTFVLDKENLSTLVNFAEWSLASTVDYQTLNFVLYVPAPNQSPLVIPDSATNSFLIPQWGGFAIANTNSSTLSATDLEPYFDIFASQLLSLLGAPTVPASPAIRLDMLSRMTAVRALRSTAASLGALARLHNHMPNIAIPQRVHDRSTAAIAGIEASLTALQNSQWARAASLAGQAYVDAERAFFDPEMVAQNFVPDEHKLAVYMPLLGPIGVVVLSGILRLVLNRKIDPEVKKAIAKADADAAAAKAEVEAALKAT